MLLIAIIITTPIAYYINNLWLQNFAIRVNFGIGILSLGILILLVIGLGAIGSQTYKAARTNPSETLRDE
jgi:putative ABC transport system permease protein